ncbi:hypothetical protein GJ629_06455 [Halapricum sp. CBA1109]|uniref:hypothetical protein n=1 Tax=Halapricum sp. CBA1109 TaxID=2668068 RepID=UPI0012F94572|nr:hypothetical protein [Halapricum sp. CBA1109]MUV89581.1 hypothetical protein [Halapricum sp. CBA1109]
MKGSSPLPVGQHTLVVLVAIALAFPAAVLTTLTPWPALAWFVLITLGIVVPSAFDYQWPDTEDTRLALAWTVTACGVAFGALVVLTAAGESVLGTDLAQLVAFLLVTFGGTVLLEAVLRKQGQRA